MGGQKGIAIFCKYLGEINELTAISVNDNDIKLAETYKMIPCLNVHPLWVDALEKWVNNPQLISDLNV